jgi:nucleoside-diphosphate-sugar epimerase
VSCIGAFGDNATMQRINGTANAAAIAAAAAAGVPRFVYVSAALPPLPGLDALLPGYVQGKRQAEEELARCYPSSGIALRPWVIYGDRQVSAHITLPLGMAFGPVAALLRRIPNARQLAGVPVVGAGFLPPVPVERVAQLAVTAATDDSMPAGVMDAWAVAGW